MFFFFLNFGSFCLGFFFCLMSFDCINHIHHIHLSHIIYVDQKIPEQCEKGTASWRSLKAESYFSILDVALILRIQGTTSPSSLTLKIYRCAVSYLVSLFRPLGPTCNFFYPGWKPPFVTKEATCCDRKPGESPFAGRCWAWWAPLTFA